jgi:hypothetical protein
MSVLSPEAVQRAHLSDFQTGRIEPMIVIEVGLDYKLHNHLSPDHEKLVNSRIRNQFLIHLVREGVSDDFDAVESFVLENSAKTAYARVSPGVKRWKLIGEDEISASA